MVGSVDFKVSVNKTNHPNISRILIRESIFDFFTIVLSVSALQWEALELIDFI